MDSLAAPKFSVLPLSEHWNQTEDTSLPEPAQKASVEMLLRRIANGDQEALGSLFESYARIVRGIASRILRNSAEAEDLVQDVFLYLQKKCGIFDGSKSSAGSWIVQMTYHRAIERRRYLTTRHFYSQAEIGPSAERVVGVPTGESDYSAEAVFGRNGLAEVVKTLSEDQRETLRLHFFEGLTMAEVAARISQPLGNVRHHYYRGLDKLRKHMFGNTVPVEEHHGE